MVSKHQRVERFAVLGHTQLRHRAGRTLYLQCRAGGRFPVVAGEKRIACGLFRHAWIADQQGLWTRVDIFLPQRYE